MDRWLIWRSMAIVWKNLRSIHSMIPELLSSVDGANRTPLHHLIAEGDEGDLDDDIDVGELLRKLSYPLSGASDILRFLLRHCPSLSTARDSHGRTLYDRVRPSEYEPDTELTYARRLLLMAWPGLRRCIPGCCRRSTMQREGMPCYCSSHQHQRRTSSPASATPRGICLWCEQYLASCDSGDSYSTMPPLLLLLLLLCTVSKNLGISIYCFISFD